MRLRRWAHANTTKALSGLLSASLLVSQLGPWPVAEAAHLGSTIASAGSAPPPAATLIESFQPDLLTGRATTAIPIVMPPGRKGLAPSLALIYASSSRNGWLGVGWDLDVGAIERSTKNGVPRGDSSDTFTLQVRGVHIELVRIPDGTYRAKDEGLFLRVENKGVSGWEVRDKAGRRYLFGGTPESEQTTPSGTFRWCLRRVSDPNGNYLTVTYLKDQGEIYPFQIQYTGHDPSSLAPTNTVDFVWEIRPDVETSSRSGVLVTTAKRLKEMTVTAQGQLVRKHQLAYSPSPRTGRSLLSSVTQVGADGTSTLPPVTFTYQSATEATYTLVSNTGLSGSNIWNVIFARVDWGSENGATLYPSQVRSYSTTTYTQRSGSFPGISWNTDSQGNLSVSGDRDMNLLFWTYVFVASARTVNVTLSQSEDSQIRFFLNGSTSEVPGWPTKSLSLNAGWNLIELTSYNQNSAFGWNTSGSLASQVDIMNPTRFIQPALSGDFNGNGLTDLALFDQPSGTWKVSLSAGSNFQVGSSWLGGFGSTSTAPILGDWDGDGRTDIATYNTGSWRFARSTGSSFQADALPSLSFGSGTPLMGDFNGDGKIDLGTYNNGAWSVALGSGSSFSSTGSFSLSWGGSQDEPLTGDFNGDGLTDVGLANRSSGNVSVALSNGSNFVIQAGTWRNGFGASQEHLVADFNGDGLSDVSYYDKATGQAIYAPSTGTSFASPKTVAATFSMRDANDQTQIADYNGDGLADPAVFDPITGQGELAFSNGAMVDLMSTQTNGLGGTATFGYVSSGLLDNTGGDGLPDLPFVVPVVDTVTLSDGLGNRYTTRYTYRGGRYDAPTKEFRGFAQVTVSDPDGNKAQTLFHQDAQKKGRTQTVSATDSGNNPYSDVANTWLCTTPYTGVSFCALSRQVTTTFDGDTTSRQAATSYEYDSITGNLTKVTEEGDTSLTGDERITQVSYALNTTDWIVNRPATITVFGADGVTKLKDQRLFYDNRPSTTDPPTLGNLTRVEEWLNTTNTYVGTTLGYDAYGNVTSVTDPMTPPRTTTLAYDTATQTFLETLTNALGHTQRFQRDVRFGVVTSATDPNNVTTQTAYDVFGRPIKVIGPNDTATLPAASFLYDLSTIPSKVTMQVREQSANAAVLTSYAFFDGLGRTIQVRDPAEDSTKQIVRGVVGFDTRGLVASQWLPYLETSSNSYVAPSTILPKVTYTYDPVGRLKSIADPDGSTTTTFYDDWAVIVTDANNHKVRTVHDAYARPVIVEEFNGTALYTTAYQYDPLDDLTQVTDSLANQTRMTYDSLSRKLTMADRDMGNWTYAYDAVDNLASQTDARGVTITFTYDALNCLTRKDYTLPPGSGLQAPGSVTYTYDTPARPFSKGRLTAIANGTGSSSFEYDNLGHVIREAKTVDGNPYVFQGGFDLLDRLTSLTYPDGEAVAYTYNAQGGIETVTGTVPGGGLSPYVANIDYNATDQPVKLAFGSGATTDYTYDPLTLRLTALTSRHPSSGTLQDFRYTYDLVGNITRIDDLAGAQVQNFNYDDLDRLTLASGPYGTPSFSYDATGNLTAKGATTLTYGNSDGSQPHAVTASSAGLVFTYDANGNMASKAATSQGAGARTLASTQFAFDAESQLARVDVPTTETVSVRFEPGWNFFALPVIPDDLSITAVFPTFSTNFDQISRYNPDTDRFEDYVGNTTFDDFTSLEYDRGYEIYCTNPAGVTRTFAGKAPSRSPASNLTNGSHLIGSSALATQSIAWLLNGLVSGTDYDTLHRYETTSSSLTPATEAKPAEAYFLHALRTTTWNPPLPKDVSTRLTYDAEGNRIKKAITSSSTTYVGDVYEKDADGATKYVFAGNLLVAAKPPSGSVRFYHPDHLGSTHVVTDTTGAQLARFSYSPFGEVISQIGSVDVPHKFTGQRFDPETGLSFYNARYYDPSLGRFLSADPLVQDPGDPQFLNRFAYVRNNPVRFVDPSGLAAEDGGGDEEGRDILCQVVIIVISFFVGRDAGESSPSLPPGPILPTPFTPLAAPGLPTSFPAADALLPIGGSVPATLTEAEIAAADVPLEPIGLLEDPFLAPLFFSAPMLRGLSWAGRIGRVSPLGRGVVEAFRVEGIPNARVFIDVAGNVSIPDTSKTLFLNFGRQARAEAFLRHRIAQGLPGATTKSFKVPKSFLKQLRRTAVREADASRFPNNPLRVDVTKAPDQFGLRQKQITDLLKKIIQGSGKVGQ